MAYVSLLGVCVCAPNRFERQLVNVHSFMYLLKVTMYNDNDYDVFNLITEASFPFHCQGMVGGLFIYF